MNSSIPQSCGTQHKENVTLGCSGRQMEETSVTAQRIKEHCPVLLSNVPVPSFWLTESYLKWSLSWRSPFLRTRLRTRYPGDPTWAPLYQYSVSVPWIIPGEHWKGLQLHPSQPRPSSCFHSNCSLTQTVPVQLDELKVDEILVPWISDQGHWGRAPWDRRCLSRTHSIQMWSINHSR